MNHSTFSNGIPGASFTVRLLFLAAWLALPVLGAEEPPLSDRVLVVYNRNLPASKELAGHYARARHIPPERVLAVDCSTEETITRAQYTRTLHQPIDLYLTTRGGLKREDRSVRMSGQEVKIKQAVSNDIWIIVLIHGIPLRIDNDPTLAPEIHVAEVLRTNRASVDSELSTLPCQGLPTTGFILNSYFSDTDLRTFSQNDANRLIMVCRLDAPNPDTVRRMIDDAVATEKIELTGRAYFDARGIQDPGSGYRLGDQWIENAAMIARSSGLETELDQQEATIPTTAPWDEAALYFGWYTTNLNGPFLQPGFRFRPGAIAYHIHSFSAETLRSRERNWAGPLLERGASATMGSVYEPYLRYTPDVSVFTRSLLNGYTFAEASYRSQLALSWTMTMLGDPLYRPYPRHFLDNLKLAEQTKDPAKPWLLLRAARLISTDQSSLETKLGKLRDVARHAGKASAFFEGYAAILTELQAGPEQTLLALRTAADSAQGAPNIIRTHLKLAAFHASRDEVEPAMRIYEKLIEERPVEAKAYNVIRIASDYAAKSGWQNVSPPIQKDLSPVNQPSSAKPEPATPRAAPDEAPPPALKPAVGNGAFAPAVK